MKYVLQVANLIPFAYETLLVFLSHMRINFIVREKTFPAELAERMDATFYLLFRLCIVCPVWNRW